MILDRTALLYYQLIPLEEVKWSSCFRKCIQWHL